jgi:lysophospholipase L1-like esterase
MIFKILLLSLLSLPVQASANDQIIVAFGDSLTRGANPTRPQNTGKKGYAPLLKTKLGGNVIILNCGIGGETSRDGLKRFEEILSGEYKNCTKDTVDSSNTRAYYNYDIYNGKRPSKVLLMMGTNDLLQDYSLTESLINLRSMIHISYRMNIEPIISLIPNITDSMLSRFSKSRSDIKNRNWMIEEVVKEFKYNKLKLVDMYKATENINILTWDGLHMNAQGNVLMADAWYKTLVQGQTKTPHNEKDMCNVGRGYKFYNTSQICSCASGAGGWIYQCNKGRWSKVDISNTTCQEQKDSSFFAHHCPIREKINNKEYCLHNTGIVTGDKYCRDLGL